MSLNLKIINQKIMELYLFYRWDCLFEFAVEFVHFVLVAVNFEVELHSGWKIAGFMILRSYFFWNHYFFCLNLKIVNPKIRVFL
jgi:hypothetical protein